MVAVDLCAALSPCSSRLLQRRRWTGGRGPNGSAAARHDVASLSGPAGTFTPLTTTPRAPHFSSTVKVEVHSSNSSSGAGSDENLSSSSSDRGSDPGTATGENDYEDIYEVRHRAEGVGLLHHEQHHHHRGKESKSPSRDSGSHSRSGSMSSTGSGTGGTGGAVGSSVVVLHTSSGGVGEGIKSVNSSSCSATVTNVTVNGSTDMIECYEPVGAMTPGM